MVNAARKLKDACSLEENQHRQHIKKQRHYFAKKGPYSQSYSFSHIHVWMWALDHKKAECQRINAFKLWCWRRLFKVPWTPWRSNQSILKEINPEYSLEGLMLKLKLQYFGHLMQRVDSLEKTLMLGKVEGSREGNGRGQDGWMALLTQWTWVCTSSGRLQRTGKPVVLQSTGLQRVGEDWMTTTARSIQSIKVAFSTTWNQDAF